MGGRSGTRVSGTRMSGKSRKSGTRTSGKAGKNNLMSKSKWISERRKMEKEFAQQRHKMKKLAQQRRKNEKKLAQLRRSLAHAECKEIHAQLRNAIFAQLFLTYANEPQGRKMLLQLPIHMRQSLSTMVQVGTDLATA